MRVRRRRLSTQQKRVYVRYERSSSSRSDSRSLKDDDILFIHPSNKKTPTPTTLITSAQKAKSKRERERRSRSTHHLCLRGVRRGAQRHGGRDDRGDRFPGDGDDRLRGGVIAVLLLRSMGGSNHRRRGSSSGSSGPGDDARRRAAARQTRHARRRR